MNNLLALLNQNGIDFSIGIKDLSEENLNAVLQSVSENLLHKSLVNGVLTITK